VSGDNDPTANIYPGLADMPIGLPAKFFGSRPAPAPGRSGTGRDNRGVHGFPQRCQRWRLYIRRSSMRGIRALVLGTLGLAAPEAAAADQSLCIYHNRSYSDGAHICVQRQLMMSCTLEGARAVWKIVEDARLAQLCATPVPPDRLARWERPEARLPEPRRRPPVPANARSAKCFTFMGRHFCE